MEQVCYGAGLSEGVTIECYRLEPRNVKFAGNSVACGPYESSGPSQWKISKSARASNVTDLRDTRIRIIQTLKRPTSLDQTAAHGKGTHVSAVGPRHAWKTCMNSSLTTNHGSSLLEAHETTKIPSLGRSQVSEAELYKHIPRTSTVHRIHGVTYQIALSGVMRTRKLDLPNVAVFGEQYIDEYHR